jgi:putative ABC transport system permease protein
MQVDRASGRMMLLILYIVIGFGILGTVIMMTMERRREFAILLGIGMHRGKLALVTFLETVMIAITGVVIGVIAGYPIVGYFHFHPIQLTGKAAEATKSFGIEPVMPFSLEPNVFVSQMGMVLMLSLLTAFYPIRNVLSLNIISGIRS